MLRNIMVLTWGVIICLVRAGEARLIVVWVGVTFQRKSI